MIEQIGGRKFILTILVLAFAFGLTLGGQVESNIFMEFSKWILGIYGITNVASKLTN